ncbi:DUF7344 domain-containing protein [Halorientalis halophila]|uniref:DUF7344 domain-containing protein n=1 Tax=Halorientalis halophila TaxID=3108499 RepID=UPI0030088D45
MTGLLAERQAGGGRGGPDVVSEGLSADDAFEVLRNGRRRRVLAYLYDVGDEGDDVTLGELAEHVAALEADTTVSDITSNERKRVYVGLYQSHLPKMDSVGVLEYDEQVKTVSLTRRGWELEPYLSLAAGDLASGGDGWAKSRLYHGGLAVAAVLLLALVTLGALPPRPTLELVLTGQAVALGALFLVEGD